MPVFFLGMRWCLCAKRKQCAFFFVECAWGGGVGRRGGRGAVPYIICFIIIVGFAAGLKE